MITEESSLADVCFAVAGALDAHGMPGVLTGGSAAALYAPQAYISHDADFVLDRDDSLDDIATALRSIGFERDGKSRIFTHPRSQFTVDFPKGPLSVGRDYVQETHIFERDGARLRILTRLDSIRDRLAHFYYWDDYTALNAAVGVALAGGDEVDLAILRSWTERETASLLEKFFEFERRLNNEAMRKAR